MSNFKLKLFAQRMLLAFVLFSSFGGVLAFSSDHQLRQRTCESAGINLTKDGSSAFTVVGYYPSYFRNKYPVEKLNLDAYDFISLAFADMRADGRLRYGKGFIDNDLVDKLHRKGIKILVSIGGWGQGKYYPKVAADPAKRKRFIATTFDFLREFDLDGVDFDWEFPANEADKNNFTILVKEFRETAERQFKKKIYFSAALGGSPYFSRFYDLPGLQKHLDFLFLMTYDFHGPWTNLSGHNSALYAAGKKPDAKEQMVNLLKEIRYSLVSQYNPFDLVNLSKIKKDVKKKRQKEIYQKYHNIAHSVDRYQEEGLNIAQAFIGIPFYGRAFDSRDLYSPFRKSRYFAYRDIHTLRKENPEFQFHFDVNARVPFLQKSEGSYTISYENRKSVEEKIAFAARRGLRGVIIWEITQDILDNGQTPLQNKIANCRKQLLKRF